MSHGPEKPAQAPPPDLPVDEAAFYGAAPSSEVDALTDPAPASALARLGAWPLPRGGFPFLGFLASVYDELAACARRRLRS
jgi:hypothetical protein